MRPVALTLSLALVAGLSADAFAQCCGTPTVAFSPVVAAPAPVVAQTTTVDSWYPGRALANFSRSLFGGSTTTTTFATPAAGVATPTTAFRPVVMDTWGATPTWGATTAYRPTFPATWGQVAYSPVVQTVNRPVVLSPVMSMPAAASACNACDACGGVAQASFMSSPTSTCSSCSAASNVVTPSGAYDSSTYGSSTLVEPAPALAPTENPPPVRSQRPEIDDTDSILHDEPAGEEKTPTDAASSNDYFNAPPLFAPPANRVTQNTHPAPVHTAVYRQPVENRAASHRTQATGKTHHLSADGWASAD
ncbi:hypothetical protein [Botrimarina mediterranea]|uniref:Uncharacterized protein n=1 Tax=Botrimarina mediterranea TaxID=2528022 RepID=A0A518K9Z6_9BACT|nr:hypothetical protein [Botrimarina mediterranea]QDV74615.1 hypothetical protein Spa11_28210 [Botrimarina mediterranea]QDV79254.1 hypothetical protein K2D_28670 [Planctomycetes bacterium K2D]